MASLLWQPPFDVTSDLKLSPRASLQVKSQDPESVQPKLSVQDRDRRVGSYSASVDRGSAPAIRRDGKDVVPNDFDFKALLADQVDVVSDARGDVQVSEPLVLTSKTDDVAGLKTRY